MSDYQKGRYDELLERYKELREMYDRLLWNFSTQSHTGRISGAQVTYYAGVKFETATIALTIGGAGIVFSISSYFLGLIPLTFGITISAIGFLYGFLSHFGKKRQEEKQSTAPPIPSP